MMKYAFALSAAMAITAPTANAAVSVHGQTNHTDSQEVCAGKETYSYALWRKEKNAAFFYMCGPDAPEAFVLQCGDLKNIYRSALEALYYDTKNTTLKADAYHLYSGYFNECLSVPIPSPQEFPLGLTADPR